MAAYFQPLTRLYCDSFIVASTNALARASRLAISEAMPNVVDSLGKALDARALPRGKLRDINMEIAKAAQDAVVSGYRSRLPRGGRSASGSLQGTLGPALASPAMLAGTSDRVISFINHGALDETARHWYRINYGAAGVNLAAEGSHAASTFTIKVNERPLTVLRDELPPAPTTWLPRNFFWYGDWFVATRKPSREVTGRGSRAAHFTDLGLRVVANMFPPLYDQFFRDWIDDAEHRLKLERKGINVIADVRSESYGYSVEVH